MLRETLCFSLCAGIVSYTATGLACPPSAPRLLVPTAVLSDATRPIARDAGIHFAGEMRETYMSGFAIEVRLASTGEVVAGTLGSMNPYLGGDVLAWLPRQPLAADTEYTIQVKTVPIEPPPPPQLVFPPVKQVQATFKTSAELLPAFEIESAPRATLRTVTQLPYRCLGPCGRMSGPCVPQTVLLADVEVPSIRGGAAERGYEVRVRVRFTPASQPEGLERTYPNLKPAGMPFQSTVEVMEKPEPVKVCFDVEATDLLGHLAMSTPFCLDAAAVAAAINGTGGAAGTASSSGAAGIPASRAGSSPPEAGARVPEAGAAGSSPSVGSAGTSSTPPSAAHDEVDRAEAPHHAEACAVAAPGAARGTGTAAVLALALVLLLRRRSRSA